MTPMRIASIILYSASISSGGNSVAAVPRVGVGAADAA